MILNAIQAGDGPPVVLLHGLFGAARNWGAVQRALAPRFRTIALDMRNHGASPHAVGMRYADLAEDVLETLHALDALPAAVVGHSMGGKAAMVLALAHPAAVGRLLVSDIAPVIYQHGNKGVAAAMRAIPLDPSLTRAQADAALQAAVPDAGVRAFLLSNLVFGAAPHWRIGLAEIAAAIPDLEGWESPTAATLPLPSRDGARGRGAAAHPHGTTPSPQPPPARGGGAGLADGPSYPGTALFVTGGNSDYVLPEHRPAIRSLFPTARFVGVKNAGHWVHADNQAGFLSVLEAFLHDWNTPA